MLGLVWEHTAQCCPVLQFRSEPLARYETQPIARAAAASIRNGCAPEEEPPAGDITLPPVAILGFAFVFGLMLLSVFLVTRWHRRHPRPRLATGAVR